MNQDAEDLDDGVKKLIGKTISHVWVDMNDGELEFHLSTNNVLHIWHQHQCSECVYLADIAGIDSLNQLEGETVLDACVSYSDGERMKRYYKRIVAVDRALKCLIAKYPAAVFYAFVCPTGSLQHFDALTRHDSA